MIDLFILRHGIAAERKDWAPRKESERPLTARGEKEVRRIGKALRSGGFTFDLILSSPFARARQTAEIVAARLHSAKKLKFAKSLVPGSNPRRFLEGARELFGKARCIMVVGHEPFLTALISLLIRGDPQTQLKLKKAGLCKIKLEAVEAGGGMLEWLLTPAQCLVGIIGSF